MKIAATGHRPVLMPCSYNENHPWAIKVKKKTTEYLENQKPDIGISGMAIGFDTWFAESCLNLGIDLYAYIPFEGQSSNWPKISQTRYQNILNKAKFVNICCKQYEKDCFLKRDRRMVDDSDKILALLNFDIKKGGTFYTVNYAKNNKKEVTNIWPI